MPTIPPGLAFDEAARQRIAALVKLFRDAVAGLQDIERMFVPGTFAPGDAAFLRARIREAEEIIDALLRIERGVASGAVVDWAREHFPATYRHGLRRAARDLGAQASRVVPGTTAIHGRAVESLLGRYLTDATQLVYRVHSNVIRTSRVVLEQAGFGREIAQGIIGGLPRREVSRQLARSLGRAVTDALPSDFRPDLTHIEIGGRSYRIDTWAEMHARTETARASTAGTRVLAELNDVRHVQITTHAHKPCICTPFEGRIYALQPNDPAGYPHISEVPNGGCPMHVNCVHREAPAVLRFLEARGETAGRDTIPAEFRGLSVNELAKKVRENADQLRRYSEQRDGYMPANFRLRRAA